MPGMGTQQQPARHGDDCGQAKSIKAPPADGRKDSSIKTGALSTLLRVFHPLLVFDAYTFRWLGFDPREHENTREQAFTKVSNVGLISALVFTVWASWLQVVAETSFENYGALWAQDAQGIASALLCAGTYFLLFSVINSVLILLAVNETEDDHQAMRLLVRLNLWFTLPSIYFYLGVACGSFGFMIWFPAAFSFKYALFDIAAGLFIITINAPFYQFLILCVYDTRVEAGLEIPAPPHWARRLGMFKQRQPARASDSPIVVPSKEIQTRSAVDTIDDDASGPVKVLQRALDSVEQRDLLPLIVENGWDHLDSLEEMKERHILALSGLKPGHAARFLRCLRREIEVYRSTGDAS